MAPEIPEIVILGGGLAGSEAAWQLAAQGLPSTLYEMRPTDGSSGGSTKQTAAHKTGYLAELVCSNSLKSEQSNSAPWLLKEELRRLDSLLLRIAAQVAVPAGHALAVDREQFAARVTAALESQPLVTIRREEVREIPASGIVIVATGPLTSDALAASLQRLTGSKHLFFYDAISPIVDAESLDYTQLFPASRYGKGGEDYWNCPLSREEYDRFYEELLAAESYPLHEFEETCYFEACLPLEELARRGRDTLRFGPMKPVGLRDPRTGRPPYAAVQLRRENLRADSFNLVGFQNHLRCGEQARALRLIPGLEKAVFLRYGQVHRNTYINSPALLDQTLALRTHPVYSLPDRFAEWKATWNRSPQAWWQPGMREPGPAGRSLSRCRAKPRWAHSATMSATPTRATTSPPTSPSIYSRRRKGSPRGSAKTNSAGAPDSASRR